MMNNLQSRALSILGTVLILCGVIAIIIIGAKAKNMAIAAIGVGAVAWILSWLSGQGRGSIWLALSLSLASSCLFGQRAIANMLSLIGIVQHEMNMDAYNKCITVVLMLIMCMASVCSLMILFSNMKPVDQQSQ
ncbi:hypothetical protein BH11BAC2_BH11BAC2_23650 [soil metagenome]